MGQRDRSAGQRDAASIPQTFIDHLEAFSSDSTARHTTPGAFLLSDDLESPRLTWCSAEDDPARHTEPRLSHCTLMDPSTRLSGRRTSEKGTSLPAIEHGKSQQEKEKEKRRKSQEILYLVSDTCEMEKHAECQRRQRKHTLGRRKSAGAMRAASMAVMAAVKMRRAST